VDRDYYLERRYPAFGNLVPRDVASRAAKERCDAGYGVNKTGEAVYLDFSAAIERYGKLQANVLKIENPSKEKIIELGRAVVSEKYGNLFDMYENIVGENPYDHAMKIYPAVHYTMGGLWVDYELQTTIPGLYAAGEANFSDHGTNRLGASALMQGLADGYFVLPYTISNGLAPLLNKTVPGTDHPEFKRVETEAKVRFQGYLDIKGTRSPDYFHRELGKLIWNYCGMERDRNGLEKALTEIPALYSEFKKDLRVTGTGEGVNQTLEKAGRVDDFFQLGTLMCKDALTREESAGGHFRVEYQTEEGEAVRDDENFCHVAAWEWTGDENNATRHEEQLSFESVQLATRSYK
jgi:succinate dehydrogenase / fumarate reductase flavoprotein subunit